MAHPVFAVSAFSKNKRCDYSDLQAGSSNTDCHKNEKSSLVLSDHLKPSIFVWNVGDIHHMRLRREVTEEPSLVVQQLL